MAIIFVKDSGIQLQKAESVRDLSLPIGFVEYATGIGVLSKKPRIATIILHVDTGEIEVQCFRHDEDEEEDKDLIIRDTERVRVTFGSTSGDIPINLLSHGKKSMKEELQTLSLLATHEKDRWEKISTAVAAMLEVMDE